MEEEKSIREEPGDVLDDILTELRAVHVTLQGIAAEETRFNGVAENRMDNGIATCQKVAH
jgi:hypothetical protein